MDDPIPVKMDDPIPVKLNRSITPEQKKSEINLGLPFMCINFTLLENSTCAKLNSLDD